MDAAAVRRQSLVVALAAVVGLASLSLAGCGGSSFSLFESASETASATSQPTAVAQAPIARVAINSIVGPPDALGKQLHREFASALEQNRIAVAQSKGKGADFNLRPYILAAKEGRGTKVSYVLDVSDPSGKRVNRFAGEEMVPGSPSADPWAAITPSVAQAIAAKATSAFVAWVPTTQPTAVAQASPRADAGVPKRDDAQSPRPAARKAARKRVASSSSQTTGSIAKGDGVTAVVPAVTGAPGDGNTTLTAAIHRELRTKGVRLAARPTSGAYRIQGAVTMGEVRQGKQPIQIEWVVKDPKGKKLGTVSQKNDVPEGRLDDKWGDTASQAARAAVQGIMKLLPATKES